MRQQDLPYYQLRLKILKQHLDRFPDAPTKTIARILSRDYPEYYKDVEDARRQVNYYRGTNGKCNRKKLTDKRYVKQVQSA